MPFERRDEVGRLDPLRHAVDPAAAVLPLEDPRQDQVQELLGRRRLAPLLGQLDRRLDELRPRQAAEPALRLLEPGDEARHGDRALADMEDLRRRVAEVDHDLLHLAERARRRCEEAVEQATLTVDPGEQEAASRRTGQGTLRHGCGKRGRNAGVDRVATLSEHARACLCGDPVSSCDRSLHELSVKIWRRCR